MCVAGLAANRARHHESNVPVQGSSTPKSRIIDQILDNGLAVNLLARVGVAGLEIVNMDGQVIAEKMGRALSR